MYTGLRIGTAFFLCGVLYLIAGTIIFGQVTHHNFLGWDDIFAYVDNPNLHRVTKENIKWVFASPGDGIWKPLVYLSFMLEFQLVSITRVGVHLLINPVIHILNSVLVSIITIKISGIVRDNFYPSNGNKICSSDITSTQFFAGLIAGLWFVLHPVHVEVAVWLSARKDLLAALFYFLSVIFWIDYIVQNKKNYCFLMVFICQALSLMCKPMATTLPVILITIDLLIGRERDFKMLLLEKWPLWVLSIMIVPIAFWGQSSVNALPTFDDLSLSLRVAQGVDTYLMYISKIFIPMSFSPHYAPLTNIDWLRFCVGLFLLLLIFIFTVISYCRKQWLIFFVLSWYLITFFPVSGWIQVGGQRTADRYAYIPTMSFFCVCAIWLVDYSRGKVIFFLASIIYSCWLVYASYIQVGLWKNDRILWRHAISLDSRDPLAYLNLGMGYYMDRGQHDDYLALALENLKLASDIAEKKVYYLETEMIVCQELRHWECALDAARRGINAYPEESKFYMQAGYFSAFIGEQYQALNYFNQALMLNRSDVQSLWGKANVLFELRRLSDVRKVLNKLLSLNPDHEKALVMSAKLFKTGNKESADAVEKN